MRRSAAARPHLAGAVAARVRAGLSLGVVLGLGAVGTSRMDRRRRDLGDQLQHRHPGRQGQQRRQLRHDHPEHGHHRARGTSAEVLTVRNGGTLPLKYTMTGGLTGTNAAVVNARRPAAHHHPGATRTGTGSTATCTGDRRLHRHPDSTTTTRDHRHPRGPLHAAAPRRCASRSPSTRTRPPACRAHRHRLLHRVGTSDVS